MSDNPEQLGADALRSMTPEQVVQAHRDGRFANLAAGNDAQAAAQRVKVNEARALLRQMTPDEIAAATRDGRLDGLLGRE